MSQIDTCPFFPAVYSPIESFKGVHIPQCLEIANSDPAIISCGRFWNCKVGLNSILELLEERPPLHFAFQAYARKSRGNEFVNPAP